MPLRNFCSLVLWFASYFSGRVASCHPVTVFYPSQLELKFRCVSLPRAFECSAKRSTAFAARFRNKLGSAFEGVELPNTLARILVSEAIVTKEETRQQKRSATWRLWDLVLLLPAKVFDYPTVKDLSELLMQLTAG